ncbi:MAG: ankyrin repeat domain-containing protein [Bdellovibrionales bacterium]|nr:ankyrin repeat domain-containing protein [Bdellovibrionales bacterium]
MKYFILTALSWACFSWANVNPLLTMTTEPSVEQLQSWIDEGHNIDEKNKEGLTPLIIAAKNKWHQTVLILLDNKADVSAVDKDGNTALHHTAYNNDLKTARIILSHQETAHQGEHTLREKLIESITKRFEPDYVKVNAYNKEHKTALMIAVQKGFLDYVKMLMPYKPNIEAHDSDKQTSLFYAVKNENLLMVQHLIRENANVRAKDKKNNMAIHFAVQLKSYSIVEALAMDGKSPLDEASAEFPPLLHMAVMELDTKMIQILLRAGANVDNIHTGEHYKVPPLALLFVLPDTIEDKMLEVAQLFIDRHASVNTTAHSPVEKNTFLHIAVDKNYERLADLLLSAGAKLDEFNSKGLSPVTLAIVQNKPRMVKKFMKAGADPNHKPSDIFYFYHLHLAAYYGFVDIVDILLEAKASLTLKDANDNTALHKALDTLMLSSQVKTDDDVAQIVEKILNKGSDPNTQDNEGLTPAMKAVRANNFKALEALKNKGADFTITDKRGRTVYDHLEHIKNIHSDWDVSKLEKVLPGSKTESGSSSCEKELSGPA